MTKCFVSYSSSDRILAETLVNSLRMDHFEIWIDIEGISGGTQWEQEITRALQTAEVCLVILTPDAIQSDWVKKEVEMARVKDKPIIPLLMRPTPIPDGLVVLKIADLQFIDF